MHLSIGNAPCSWGVEFADDPRNPPWTAVLDEARAAGYRGIELGPLGYMPEDPAILGPALGQRGLTLIGGVLFRPFHDPAQWEKVRDAARRTCRALVAHGAKHMVLIDSISPRRAPTAGRPAEAERLRGAEREGLLERLRTVAKMGSEEHGLTVSMHAHAAGFVEFEDELEDVLASIEPRLLQVCLDSGHSVYAGFDPVAFFRSHADRISYLHFKDVNPAVLRRAVENRTGFYDACAAGVFCNLGEGVVDFPALKREIDASKFSGWGTVEQDRDPKGARSTLADASANLKFLESVGLA
ncbi:MAG TPA: sugar phosphate isomerase/epimerase [Steroidobacteraceae bacterium]|jgi:inosose dehydratase|nr:sugar phosphate isomerase/epimerase [Steroidobacteraceae bacterium]